MFTLELVTLDGIKFNEEVYEVVLPTPDGYIAILPHHMQLVSLVEAGIITIRRNKTIPDDQLEMYAINGGIVEVDAKRIRVLVDEADHSDELNEQEIEAALERAQELARGSKDQIALEKANQQIHLAKARLRVAEMRRRSRTRR